MSNMSKDDIKLDELIERDRRFREDLDRLDPDWSVALFFNSIDMFYFTGTLQNGVYIVSRDDQSRLFVKRSYDRARIETPLEEVYPIKSFGDIKKYVNIRSGIAHIKKSATPIEIWERFNKYFDFKEIRSMDRAILNTRAIKSDRELEFMKESGRILENALIEIPPLFLKPRVSELELGSEILREMLLMGHEGICRMESFNSEMFLGDVNFGNNANYPNRHNGPAGLKGLSNASPLLGSRNRRLKDGDLIFLDMVCNYKGYYTDKTVVYSLGRTTDKIKDLHGTCLEIEQKIVSMLWDGEQPARIYDEIYKQIDKDDKKFVNGFMGYGSNKVSFLGHGIGLVVDEYPVLAKGFNDPLKGNMTIAVEPKLSIKDIGMVGSENTYVVAKSGGISLTGKSKEIIEI